MLKLYFFGYNGVSIIQYTICSVQDTIAKLFPRKDADKMPASSQGFLGNTSVSALILCFCLDFLEFLYDLIGRCLCAERYEYDRDKAYDESGKE